MKYMMASDWLCDEELWSNPDSVLVDKKADAVYEHQKSAYTSTVDMSASHFQTSERQEWGYYWQYRREKDKENANTLFCIQMQSKHHWDRENKYENIERQGHRSGCDQPFFGSWLVTGCTYADIPRLADMRSTEVAAHDDIWDVGKECPYCSDDDSNSDWLLYIEEPKVEQ